MGIKFHHQNIVCWDMCNIFDVTYVIYEVHTKYIDNVGIVDIIILGIKRSDGQMLRFKADAR